MVKGRDLCDTSVQIKCANGEQVNVLGRIELPIVIAGLRLRNEFIVSDQISEIVFGCEFLRANRCQWDLGRDRLCIRGRSLRLCRRPSSLSNAPCVLVSYVQVLCSETTRTTGINSAYSDDTVVPKASGGSGQGITQSRSSRRRAKRRAFLTARRSVVEPLTDISGVGGHTVVQCCGESDVKCVVMNASVVDM